MPVEDVRPGMKGYGLTVFTGTRPERFDVEVIATLRNFRPKMDLILIKTPHPRLEVARTVAGMSGSPIFINGKMIGAYAYGWYYNIEPIAGVTPIESMLTELRRPIPPALAPKGAAPLPGSTARGGGHEPRPGLNTYKGPLLGYDLRRHAAQIAERTGPALAPPAGTSLRAAGTDVMVAGMSSRALALLGELFAPIGLRAVQAGGAGGQASAEPDAPKRYVDGGVLTVQMVSGDVSVSALGTVTHVAGDKLVAFGHPMLFGGIEALPTALGRVHWVLAAQNRSFKIGEPTVSLGTLVNDRQAAIVVDTAHDAPVFPVSVDIDGVPGSPFPHWSMEVGDDPFLAPSMVALAIGSALETTTAERGEMTWRAASVVDIEGYGQLRIEDFGAGSRSPIGPSDISRARVGRALGALLNNPWEVPHIKAVRTRVSVKLEREVLQLRGAQVVEPEIDAGQPAHIRLTLNEYQGGTVVKDVEVPLPRSLAGKTVKIQLQPAYLVDRLVPAPESMRELVQALGKVDFPSEAIVASFELPDEAAATFRGLVAERLPPGAVDMLRSSSQSVTPELFTAQRQVAIPIDGFLAGSDTVEVKVREVLR
jgi:hypothetical protein